VLTAAFATVLALLGAAVQLQYGPEWTADAAVRAAIARDDLRQAGEMAITAQQWGWIAEARSQKLRDSSLHSARRESMILVGDAGGNREQ
jgi:hypothetical protein